MSQSRVRESTTQIFYQAFKQANDTCDDTIIKDIANNLQEAVLALTQVQTSKQYREKINWLQMRLKGSHNSAAREALVTQSISCQEFTQLQADQFNEAFFKRFIGGKQSESASAAPQSIKPPQLPFNAPLPRSGVISQIIPQTVPAPKMPTTNNPPVSAAINEFKGSFGRIKENKQQNKNNFIEETNDQHIIEDMGMYEGNQEGKKEDNRHPQSNGRLEESSSVSQLMALRELEKQREGFLQQFRDNQDDQETQQGEEKKLNPYNSGENQYYEKEEEAAAAEEVEEEEEEEEEAEEGFQFGENNQGINEGLQEYINENLSQENQINIGDINQTDPFVYNQPEEQELEIQLEYNNENDNDRAQNQGVKDTIFAQNPALGEQMGNQNQENNNIQSCEQKEQQLIYTNIQEMAPEAIGDVANNPSGDNEDNNDPFQVHSANHSRFDSFSNPECFLEPVNSNSRKGSRRLEQVQDAAGESRHQNIDDNEKQANAKTRNREDHNLNIGGGGGGFTQVEQLSGRANVVAMSRGKEEGLGLSAQILRLELVKKGLDYAEQTEKVELLKGENDALKKENFDLQQQIRRFVSERALEQLKGKNKGDEKDKKIAKLESELETTQGECKMISEHLNKMMIENSQFQDQYTALKLQRSETQNALAQQLEELKGKFQAGTTSQTKTLGQLTEEIQQQRDVFENSVEELQNIIKEKDQVIESYQKLLHPVPPLQLPNIPVIQYTPLNLSVIRQQSSQPPASLLPAPTEGFLNRFYEGTQQRTITISNSSAVSTSSHASGNNNQSRPQQKPQSQSHSTGSINQVSQQATPSRDADSGSTAVLTRQNPQKPSSSINNSSSANQSGGAPPTAASGSSGKNSSSIADDNLNKSGQQQQQQQQQQHQNLQETQSKKSSSTAGGGGGNQKKIIQQTDYQTESQKSYKSEASENKISFSARNENDNQPLMKIQTECVSSDPIELAGETAQSLGEPQKVFVQPQLANRKGPSGAAGNGTSNKTPVRQVLNATNAFGLDTPGSVNNNEDARSEKSQFSQRSSHQFLNLALGEPEDFFRSFDQDSDFKSKSAINFASKGGGGGGGVALQTDSQTSSVSKPNAFQEETTQTLERPPSTSSLHSNVSMTNSQQQPEKSFSQSVIVGNPTTSITPNPSQKTTSNPSAPPRNRVKISGNQFD